MPTGSNAKVTAMSKRVIMRIELTPGAKKAVSELSKKRGMTQVAVSSRLVEWFARQPESVQAAILGQYPAEIEADVAKIVLQQLAKQQNVV